MVTIESLKADIRSLGICPGDTVLIHTSMRAIGPVEGGADTVIDAFCQVLEEGLLLVPTHTWAVVNRKNPVYDVRKTVPNIGALPRVAAFRPDGIRSLHPTHSMWGHGKKAEEYLAGEELAQSPGPKTGAWGRLADVGGKILLIGVGNDRNTFLHAVEEIGEIPDRLAPEPYEVTIYDREGGEIRHLYYGHQCSKTDDVSAQYVNFNQAFDELEVWQEGKLGNAVVKILDAKKCRDTVLKIYSRANWDICIEKQTLPPELWR